MSSISNAQQGTRGLSSSDWTRLKRIVGAKPNIVTSFSEPVYAGTPIDNSQATTFVLACIDPRYTAALEEYLLQMLGANTYDLFILAGAAGGGNITNTSPHTCIVTTTNWQTTLLDHLQLAITLHNVTKILVVDHLDCGAYHVCLAQNPDVSADHKAQFDILHDLIVGATPGAGTGVALNNHAGSPSHGGDIFGTRFTGYYFTTPLPTEPNTTILNDYSGAQQTTEYFPDSKGAKVLVLGCIDPRFTALLSSFLVNYKDVQFIYDLFILAGASLGANQSYTTFPTLRTPPATGNYPSNIIPSLGGTWGPTFFDHVGVAIALHQITEVWVFDHLDCGAYKAIKFGSLSASDLDPAQHVPELTKLQGYLSTAQPSLAFKGFVMDTNGSITKYVDDNRGITILKTLGAPMNQTLYSLPRLLPKTTGGSRIRFTASQYTDQKAYYAADYITQQQSTNNGVNTNGKILTVSTLCSCSAPPYVANKRGLCIKCSHDNRWK